MLHCVPEMLRHIYGACFNFTQVQCDMKSSTSTNFFEVLYFTHSVNKLITVENQQSTESLTKITYLNVKAPGIIMHTNLSRYDEYSVFISVTVETITIATSPSISEIDASRQNPCERLICHIQ